MDDYLGDLLNGDAQYAINKLLQDLRIYKFTTAKQFFDHPGSEDFLWALLKQFCCSESAIQAGNVAFAVSTLSEYNAEALPRFVAVAKSIAKYGMQLVRCISEFVKPTVQVRSLFSSDTRTLSREEAKKMAQDAESRMNIVGLIATFAEDDQGRGWLVNDPYFSELLETMIDLFNTRVSTCVDTDKFSSQLSLLWTVSNAALVFARLLLDTAFLQSLFGPEWSDKLDDLLHKMVAALQFASFELQDNDESARLVSELNEAAVALRLNAAFALGRICCTEKGVERVFSLGIAEQLCLSAARLVCNASVYVFRKSEQPEPEPQLAPEREPPRSKETLVTQRGVLKGDAVAEERARARLRRRERHSAASRNGDASEQLAVFRVQTARYLSEDHSAEFKNSCYALSSFIASSERALQLLVDESKPQNVQLFDLLVLRMLQVLKQCKGDDEAIWFATMLLREMVGRKPGRRAFRLKNFIENVQMLSRSERLSDEVRHELRALLKRLEKLDAPQFVPDACTNSSNSVQLRWMRVIDRNFNLPIRYKLFECSSEPYLLIREMQLDCITPLGDDSKNLPPDALKSEGEAWNLIDGDACTNSQCFYAVEGLTCSKDYTFRVQAETEVQQSALSEPITLTTKEALPDEPRNLRIIAVTTSQIRVVWEPPEHPNGTIRKYTVAVSPCGIARTANVARRGSRDFSATEHQWPKQQVTNELNAILSGLTADTAYVVSVSAANSFGCGPAAQLNVETLRYGPHSPQRVRFLIVGRHEVQLMWDAPQRIVGKLTRYEVMVNRRVVYAGVSTQCTVIRLKPDTEYKFVVCALTTVGRFECRPVKRRTANDGQLVVLGTEQSSVSRHPSAARESSRKSLPNFAATQPADASAQTQLAAPAETAQLALENMQRSASSRLLTRRRFSDFGNIVPRSAGGNTKVNADSHAADNQPAPIIEPLQVSTESTKASAPAPITAPSNASELDVELKTQKVKMENSNVKLPNLVMRYQSIPKQPAQLAAASSIDLEAMAKYASQAANVNRKAARRSARSSRSQSGNAHAALPNKVLS